MSGACCFVTEEEEYWRVAMDDVLQIRLSHE